MGRNIEINPIRLELRYKLEEDFAQAVCAGNRKRVNELLEYRQRIFPIPIAAFPIPPAINCVCVKTGCSRSKQYAVLQQDRRKCPSWHCIPCRKSIRR